LEIPYIKLIIEEIIMADCITSPRIYVGETFVHHYANIGIEDLNPSAVMAEVTPLGESSEYEILPLNTPVPFETDDYNLTITATSISTLGDGSAIFKLCWTPKVAPPTMCTQTFKLQDQSGNPLNGNVQIGTTAITVLGTGTISLEQGKAYTAVASYKDLPTQTKTFTACTTTTFVFDIHIPTGTISTNKSIYEQGEPVVVSWSNVNFDGTIEIVSPVNILEKTYSFMTPSGLFSYTLHDTAIVGTWSVTLYNENQVIKEIQFTVIEKPEQTGLLICDSSPDDAEIWINGSNTGEYTPRSFTDMVAGSYDVTFKKDGYHDCSKTVTVIVDQAVSAFCSLIKTITTGQLNCSTGPTGAKIYLNNEYVDVTNVNIIDLEPGTYDVRYELDGYETFTKTVIIEAGKTTYLAKVLVPIEEYASTSIIIGINPLEIGIGQYSTITGGLHIDGMGLILPGIPIKLYVDKGQGFVHIATPNTPADGTGRFEYSYKAIQEDVGKTLSFKYVYEGSESLLLESSESMVLNLIVESEPILVETKIELSASPNVNVAPTTIVQLTAYLTDIDNNPLPDGSFVNFYKNNEFLITTGTTNGYAYLNHTSVIEDSEQTVTFRTEYLGIQNVYNSSESTTNVVFEEYIPLKECLQYITQQECEDNGCYWHSDNTCQIAPEGTTEYFDVHIKPYSFYNGKYEEAVSKALTLMTDLTGAMSNYISSITGYEYRGVDILEDANKQVIVVRVYLEETDETALVHPAIIAGAVIVIAAIMLAIGYIIGTSEGDFSKADITQLAKDIITNAEIDAYEHAYDIDKSTAIKLIDCLRTIETCDDSLTCFENNNVTPSLSNQMEVLVAYETSIDSVYTGVADTIEDAEFEAFATKTLAELEIVIEKLESATITPEGAACTTTDIIDDTIEDLDEKAEEYEDEECAFEIAGTCIVTKKAAKTLTIVAIGIGGLVTLSAVKGITKK
jgi:hypothetical protein